MEGEYLQTHYLYIIIDLSSYHDKFLESSTNQVGNNFGSVRVHPELNENLHVHMSVEEQVSETEPLPIEFLNACRIPPVLVELTICIQSQL